MSSESCSLLACQVTIPTVRNAEQKFNHIDRMIEKASANLEQRPAQLVVFPELASIEYSREAFDHLPILAEQLDGPSVERMRRLATRYRTTVVFGMPRCSEGQYFISQLVIGCDGEILTCYDKLHICQYGASMEKEYFHRGRSLSVFSVGGFRFAPIICYDIRFPELCRTLTLEKEVDCILHCGAYYRDESFASWHSFAITRAMENQLYLLSLNRAGEQYGDSIFCLPWMDTRQPEIHFSTHGEDFRYFEIERSNLDKTRERYSILKDRITDYKK
jgi:nitrilase